MQGLGRARGRGVGVGAVGAGMLGKHVAVAAAGFPISGGFRGAGWGFPKAKVPYMGTTGWCRTHPRWPGTAWGGCRKFSEISGNCRQLPAIAGATLERQVFQSWAVWCSPATCPAPAAWASGFRGPCACCCVPGSVAGVGTSVGAACACAFAVVLLHVHLRPVLPERADHAPDDAGVQSDSRVWGRRGTPGSHRAGGQNRAMAGRARGPRLRLHRQVAQPGAVCRRTRRRDGSSIRALHRSLRSRGAPFGAGAPPSNLASRRRAVLARQVSADREN